MGKHGCAPVGKASVRQTKGAMATRAPEGGEDKAHTGAQEGEESTCEHACTQARVLGSMSTHRAEAGNSRRTELVEG